jgi:hypothetical protein
MWTASKKRNLLRNWKNRKTISGIEKPTTIALPANYL